MKCYALAFVTCIKKSYLWIKVYIVLHFARLEYHLTLVVKSNIRRPIPASFLLWRTISYQTMPQWYHLYYFLV